MSSIGKVVESSRKRARTGEATTCSSTTSSSPLSSQINDRDPPKASTSDFLRANKLSKRICAIVKEFPEIKFIIDFENLQAITETAVKKYAEEKEAKKRNALLSMNYGQDTTVHFYSLPDEMLSNCLSFIGKGYYGVVGLVSKKLNEAYKEQFGKETAYLEMATSVNLANYCLNKLCKTLGEKDEILKAAAVNGKLDILRAAVKDGHDLFPLIAMKKKSIYPDITDFDQMYDDDSIQKFDVYYADDDKRKVKLTKLVERGHLHVLKYLYEELKNGLQRYCKPAIEHGKLEILEWLHHIGIMGNDSLRIGFIKNGKVEILHFGECAIKSGNVESLEWLMKKGYEVQNRRFNVLSLAIRSKSTDMIQYCFDIGYANLNSNPSLVKDAIKRTKSAEVYRKMHELGYEFHEMKKWYNTYDYMDEYFEIIKFLRSISVPWDDRIMKDIVASGTLEMIQYAHEDGCPWTTLGEEYNHLFELNRKWSMDKFKYLIDNGCTVDYEHANLDDLIRGLRSKKELELLDYFVGKNSSFDNQLFKECFESYDPWFEGISYLLEKGKDVPNFKSLEEVFQERLKIDGIKYFHSLGFPWCIDSSRNIQLLSEIACYNDLEDVKWAYENGCNGGNLVSYVEKEWKRFGIRDRDKWKANQAFFEENGLLDEVILEKSGIKNLDSMNVQEIGDKKFVSVRDGFLIDYTLLKILVDYGYMFASESEKEAICKQAYKKCCEHSHNKEECRKRFALFVGMRVRDL